MTAATFGLYKYLRWIGVAPVFGRLLPNLLRRLSGKAAGKADDAWRWARGLGKRGEANVDELFDLSKSIGAARVRPNVLPSNARSLTGKSGVKEMFRRLEKYNGINKNLASKRLHEVKHSLGYAPDDDLLFDLSGNMFDPKTREWIGSLTEGGGRAGF